MKTILSNVAHRRFNPLLQEWVLVSPHRLDRPWRGQLDTPQEPAKLVYDPTCYLCPGNERHTGARNPNYERTYVFENDYPALLPDQRHVCQEEDALLIAISESGTCRVLCFSPRHDLTIARMSQKEVETVVASWCEQFKELDADGRYRHVQIFENRGALMGASNPHPHCQIWADATLPNIPEKELNSFRAHYQSKGSCLLCDYLEVELARNERIVCQNDSFTVLVPYWAIWPFETLVLGRRHLSAMDELSQKEHADLAEIMRHITTRYDNLFRTDCPYSMGFHQRPSDGAEHQEWHLHAHYYPPLLRSASIQKFMVGYELLDSPQRDMTAESAAARLVDAGEIHYLSK